MSNIEIRWPTVALVVGVCAAVVAIFAFAGPDERVQLLGILAMLGTAGAAVMRAAFGAEPKPAPKRIELPRDDDDDTGAGGDVLADGAPTVPQRRSSARNTMLREEMLRAVVPMLPSDERVDAIMDKEMVKRVKGTAIKRALSVPVGLVLLVGCSPSALRTHATIALVASHTLEVTRASALASCAALRDTCAADVSCIERTRVDCLAVADAQDATVAAVAVYVDAVELAALADEGRVMEALRFALEAASRAWTSLGERLAVVGISLPALGGVR